MPSGKSDDCCKGSPGSAVHGFLASSKSDFANPIEADPDAVPAIAAIDSLVPADIRIEFSRTLIESPPRLPSLRLPLLI